MDTKLSRLLLTLLATQFALSACTSVRAGHPAGQWPQPQSFPQPQARTVPGFHAPSATHCTRPVRTHEQPGGGQDHPISRGDAYGHDRLAKSSEAARERAAPAAPAARAESRALADMAASERAAGPGYAPPQGHPMPYPVPQPTPQPQQRPAPVVTAGMVDDNANFDAYLAFRDRTRVHHRPRDVRERYLLEVKDGRGRGIADAEVAVRAPAGYAMWARTDAGGRAWLHPDAFDPSRSAHYEVAVRKHGRESYARLDRGQRSSVEVRLDTQAAPARAQLDLVFLIDATGSMADEIDKLKTSLRTIVAEVSRLPSRPDLCLGLVAYRDKGDAFLVRSHDLTDDVGGFLRGALRPLHAGGGGDYPEAMNEALHEAVHRISWRGDGATRMVVLLADAPPHLDYGAPHYDEDMLAALGKGIKVFSVGASGLDRQGEFIQRQIAQYTGGKFVFLTYAHGDDPASGPGRETSHDVKNYSVDTLDRLIVRLVTQELGKLAQGS